MDPESVLRGLALIIESQAKVIESLTKEIGSDYGVSGRRDKMVETVQATSNAAIEVGKSYHDFMRRLQVVLGKGGKLDIRLIRPDELPEDKQEESDGD